jgi:hypothetical protein
MRGPSVFGSCGVQSADVTDSSFRAGHPRLCVCTRMSVAMVALTKPGRLSGLGSSMLCETRLPLWHLHTSNGRTQGKSRADTMIASRCWLSGPLTAYQAVGWQVICDGRHARRSATELGFCLTQLCDWADCPERKIR